MEWWMWLSAGLGLLVLELVTPSGFFIMFFGLGALTVGVLTRLEAAGPSWVQWLVFTVVSIAYLLLFRGRLQDRVDHKPDHTVDSLVGELATPRERIAPNAIGRVELRGTQWTARNTSAIPVEPGQRCRVMHVNGLELNIQPE